MGQTDKQYDGILVDEYFKLKRIRDKAVGENASETVKAIDEELEIIKIKLQPLSLPED